MLRILLVCLGFGMVCPGNWLSAEEPAPTPVVEVRELFNGHDLTNWYTFIKDRGRDSDPKKVFTVRDGTIHISGEELGCITTEEAFENYRLQIEYRWTGQTFPPRIDKARDCGVLIHSVGKDGGWHKTWMFSIECNIIEGGTGDFIVVGDGSDRYSITVSCLPEKQNGCGVFDPTEKGEPITIHGGRVNWFQRDPDWKDQVDFRGANDLEKPVGEWNLLEVIADGDTITNIVNGKVANIARNVRPQCGKIQIQSEFAGIEIRKITLLPLEPKKP
ncbi:MAG: DUF1080 domain-containing protein [Planctomycetia bacterium]|nr:DUF1080 domain-containing protein [Planctomycetia bacterium]